jgi:hypothetical protein
VKAGKHLVNSFAEMPKLTLEEAVGDVLKGFRGECDDCAFESRADIRQTVDDINNQQSLRRKIPCIYFSLRGCKLSRERAQISYRNAVLYLEAKTKADKYL